MYRFLFPLEQKSVPRIQAAYLHPGSGRFAPDPESVDVGAALRAALLIRGPRDGTDRKGRFEVTAGQQDWQGFPTGFNRSRHVICIAYV